MRCSASVLVVLVLAGLTAGQALAQRGGGHIGISISPGSSSGLARMGSPSSLQVPRLLSRSPGSFYHSPPQGWPVNTNREFHGWPLQTPNLARGYADGHRHDGDRRREYGGPNYFGAGGYLIPNAVGYPFGYPFVVDGFDDDQQGYQEQNTQTSPGQNPQGEGAGPAPGVPPGDQNESYVEPGPPPPSPPLTGNEQASPSYRPPYQGAINGDVHAQPATTLIFKDGKPSTQVHNYVLTSSTLYELDEGTSLEIPISEIDLPATIAANRAAGVEFSLPANP
jgi:hypothetical protein